ncbi:kinase-like domain-containing protein, partial [Mycena sp. CBHHK59/15]
ELRDVVAALHDKGIVHGDVKPQNVLLCSADRRVRLCDFGFASFEGDGFVSTVQTIPYSSPFRVHNDTVPITRTEDTYALGMTV